MKTFKQHIKESHASYGVGTQDQNSAEDSNKGAHNIDNPEVLKSVNAFVGAIADREYIDPSHAVNELKEKLGRLGLSFDDVKLEGDNGTVTLAVKQFGGRFGKDIDGADINDDGVSHKKSGGLKIEFKHEKMSNNTSKVFAKLV
jgi:hypothetical protein